MKASRRHQSRPRAPWRYSYYVLKLELLAVERYVHCPDCEPSRYLGGRPVSLQTERLSDRLTVESTNFNIHLPPRYQYACTYSQVGTYLPSEWARSPCAPTRNPAKFNTPSPTVCPPRAPSSSLSLRPRALENLAGAFSLGVRLQPLGCTGLRRGRAARKNVGDV